MTERLRIAVADDEPEVLEFMDLALTALGHEVVVKANTGKKLIEQCRDSRPELVITDIEMPDMDGLEAATQMRDEEPVPVIVVSAHNDAEFVKRALQNHVLAYLIKPVKKEALQPAIELARQRFKEFQALQQETDNLRQALEDRKLIERAKGILMKRAGVDEPDAFKRLQLLSSRKNMKLAEVARTIVMAEEAVS